MIIANVIEQVNSGTPLAQAIPEGADLGYWQRLIKNYRPAKPRRKARHTTPRRQHSASEVLHRRNALQGVA